MKKITLGFAGLLVAFSVSGAIAADTKVTSKAYVDAQDNLREVLENKVNKLDDSTVHYPTTHAVKESIDALQSNLEGQIGDIDFAPYEVKSNKVTEITTGNKGSTTAYPAVGALTAWVSNQIDTAIGELESDSDATYQVKTGVTNTPMVAVSGAAWKELVKGNYTIVDNKGANVIVDIDLSKVADQSNQITSSSTNLTTAGAVYNYIDGLPANNIPAHVGTCTANNPCALVDNGGGTFIWAEIVQVPSI